MAFFRKAGNILGRTVINYVSPEISSSKPYIFQAIRCMSSSKLFIGGLSYSTDDMSLREAFNKYGDVSEARVIMDRETGRSRGFGFVTYSSVEEASAAIQALDQQELHGRRIRVDYANDRVRGYGGGGFRGGNFGGGGGSYNSGGFGGSYGTGGGYNSNYGDGGNFGGGGYGGSPNSNYRDDSYGSGTGSQGSTNYASNNSYDGGNLSYGGDSQNLGVAGGAGGSDNFNSSNAGTGSSGYGDNFGSTNYASTNSYNGGNLSYGGDGQNFGVAGGVGGSDNFFSAGAGVSSSGDGSKFGSEQTNYVAGADEGSRRGDLMDDNYRDDGDTPDNYADKRS